MQKHKSKIITAVIILSALAAAWFFGGNYASDNAGKPLGMAEVETTVTSVEGTETTETAMSTTAKSEAGSAGTEADVAEAAGTETVGTAMSTTAKNEAGAAGTEAVVAGAAVAEAAGTAMSTTERSDAGADVAEMAVSSAETNAVETAETALSTTEANAGEAGAGDGAFTVTLSVRCDELLDNMDLLKKEKRGLVPADGMIYPPTEVNAYEGESVFNILQREMKFARIHMEFRGTPVYNSSYIVAINNLYEFDAGELSGWIYYVNGISPNYGASRYIPEPGDVIELYYSCDLAGVLIEDDQE